MLTQASGMMNPLRQSGGGVPPAPAAKPAPKPGGDAELCKAAIKELASAVESGQTQGLTQKIDQMLMGGGGSAPAPGGAPVSDSDSDGY
jgi:hypothetical protein